MTFDYDTYLSPFTWRYASVEMRHVWSEVNKRRLWREIWTAIAEIQAQYGLVTLDQVADIQAHKEQVDVLRSLEIESGIHHDLMAELKTFAEQCQVGGAVLHLGATSSDIEDNADALRIRQSLELVRQGLRKLLLGLAELVERWSETPVIGFTHLQPAEPTTLGYRFSIYAQDLLLDWDNLSHIQQEVKGKGFKGAVGTRASYGELVGLENLAEFEASLSALLDLPFFPVAGQTYPRKQDYQVLCALSSMGGSVYKFAFDLRLLQSPPIGELREAFGIQQVGSSAMPFKRNPIHAEKVDSLARALAHMPEVAWGNFAHSLLERTLDDSANRRTLLPEAFLIADELVRVMIHVVKGLKVDESAITRNLSQYAPFAALERVLMALGKAGADRQTMHERLRGHALAAWESLQQSGTNPLVHLVCQDREIAVYLGEDELQKLMVADRYIGDAPQRARGLAAEIHRRLQQD